MNRRPRFMYGALLALALAVAAAISVVVLSPFLGLGSVIRLLTPLLSLVYLVYLFRTTRARTGRVVTLTAWSTLAVIAWWSVPSLSLYLLLHAGAIWLIRSFYAYSSLVPAVADLALSAIAAATFGWAFMRTGSVFLATWCFFLVQALWTFLPRRLPAKGKNKAQTRDNARFESARRQADAALRQLFSQQN